MGDAKPYPTPLEYDADLGEISHRGATIARVYDVDDFPCLEEHGADGGAIQQEIDATGNALVLRYNTHADLLAACKAFVAADNHDGMHLAYTMARAAVAKAEGGA